MANDERVQILEMLESGQITAEQAVTLIQALDTGHEENLLSGETPLANHPEEKNVSEESSQPPIEENSFSAPEPEVFAPEPEDLPEEPLPKIKPGPQRFRKFWLIPLWIGTAITLLGGLMMFVAWQNSGFGFWFACSWFPFTLGVLVLFFAWITRSTPWLHVRVRQREGQSPRNIVISFPLPLRLAGWFLRTFRNRIPGLENTNVDEIIVALENISPETPFSVEVNEDDGEHVEVYIG